jgi:hypothetical protein
MAKFEAKSKIDPKYGINREQVEMHRLKQEADDLDKRTKRSAAVGAGIGAAAGAAGITAAKRAMEKKYGAPGSVKAHTKQQDVMHGERNPSNVGNPKAPSTALGAAITGALGASAGMVAPMVKDHLKEGAEYRKERRQGRKAAKLERDYYEAMDEMRRKNQQSYDPDKKE